MRIVIGEVGVDGDVYKMLRGVNMTVPDEDLDLNEDVLAERLIPAIKQLIAWHKEAPAVTH